MPIHPATLSDLPQLAALALASKAVWGYPPELLAQWRDDLTLTPADLGRWRVRLMRDEQGIAGFYALAPDAADWRLEHLWIAPRALRQGLGRRLLAHAACVARLAARGRSRSRPIRRPSLSIWRKARCASARAPRPFPANPDARCRCCTCR